MTITQTIEIPVSRRLTIDVPRDVPTGKAIIAFTPVPTEKTNTAAGNSEKYDTRDLELINLNSEQLNREALDVLSYQNLDL